LTHRDPWSTSVVDPVKSYCSSLKNCFAVCHANIGHISCKLNRHRSSNAGRRRFPSVDFGLFRPVDTCTYWRGFGRLPHSLQATGDATGRRCGGQFGCRGSHLVIPADVWSSSPTSQKCTDCGHTSDIVPRHSDQLEKANWKT